jgi:uncharacterized membrane protein
MALASAPAYAGLTVCNKTEHAASVALGYYDGKEWSSAGWWHVAAGNCAALLKEALNARYYYIYAEHQEVGGGWDGNYDFCLRSEKFQITGRKDCLMRGFERGSFFQVDTGTSIDWTETLAD